MPLAHSPRLVHTEDVGGLQCRMHHLGQVVANGVQVDRILEPGRERGHRGLGVVPGPVKPPVHPPLHPPPDRAEQGGRGQGGGGDRDGEENLSTWVASSTSPA